jgi:hypothetical protein
MYLSMQNSRDSINGSARHFRNRKGNFFIKNQLEGDIHNDQLSDFIQVFHDYHLSLAVLQKPIIDIIVPYPLSIGIQSIA